MQPTLARAPFHYLGWINERKEDGWRMLDYRNGDRRPAAVSLAARASTVRWGGISS